MYLLRGNFEKMNTDKTLINRSIYRELFNDLCADFSIYRLTHDVNSEFSYLESKLWEYREKSIFMENNDITEYDDFLIKSQKYLTEIEN